MNQQSEIQSPRSDDPYPSEQIRAEQKSLSIITNAQVIVLLYQLLFILFNSYIAFELNVKIAILYITILQFLYIVKVGIYNNKMRKEYSCCFRIFWSLSLITYEGCLIYFFEHNNFPIQYPIIFINGYTLIWLFSSIRSYFNEKTNKNILQIIFVLFRQLITVQLMLISFKWTEWILWNWFLVFILIWIIQGSFILFQLIFLFDLAQKISMLLQEPDLELREQLNVQIIGSIWINLVLLCLTGVPTFTILCYTFELEQFHYDLNSMGITLAVLYSLVFVVYTLYYRQTLSAFIQIFKTFSQIGTGDLSSRIDQAYPNNLINSPSVRKQMLFSQTSDNKQELLKRLPQALLRLSSTYFLPDVTQQGNNSTASKKILTEQTKRPKEKEKDIKSASYTEINVEKSHLCFNCCQAESQTVYMPCGHGGLCIQCSVNWFKQKKECLICRKEVKSVVQILNDSSDQNKVKVIDILAYD